MILQEIARLAGVSKSTVSRVINNDPNVSERTRQKVQSIIETEQYQSNPMARALANQRTQIIGIVVSNTMATLFDTSFYFATILRGISYATRERDYAILLLIGDSKEDDVRFSRRIVNNQMLDGVLLVSPSIDHPIVDELITSNIPFVSADRIPRDDGAKINFVTIENIESSRQAVNHLIKLGRRRIVVIVGDPRIIDSTDRLEGYKLALADAGIPYDPRLAVGYDFSYETGYEVIQQLLDDGVEFDGVYASQSTMAVGAVNSLLDAGIRLPEDVSLIAFDDRFDAMKPRIGISTMKQDVFQKGVKLANALIDRIEDENAPPIQRFLPTELVIRDTCGGLKDLRP